MDEEQPTDRNGAQRGGDRISVGNITNSPAVAVGAGAQATANITMQALPPAVRALHSIPHLRAILRDVLPKSSNW